MIEDQKRANAQQFQIRRMPSLKKHKLGLEFLGQSYTQAFELYDQMAKHYEEQSKNHPTLLTAALYCMIFAGENATQIMRLFAETHPVHIEYKKKKDFTVQMATIINEKMKKDP